MQKKSEKRVKRHRVYESYYDYVNNVVLKCGHKYVIKDRKDFRDYRINIADKNYLKIPPSLPKGKLIKIIPAKCHSYSCPICGKKKVFDLVDRLKDIDFKKYRFFTLTLKNKYTFDDTERNLKRISTCFNKLNLALRKKKEYKGLEYFRITEIGSDGMVHLHGIWNKYIPVHLLSTMWEKITKDSFIVHIERIKTKNDVIQYLYKYMTKNIANKDMLIDPSLFNMDIQNTAALFYENGKRRYCSSRKFFSGIPKKQTNEKWLNYYYESETSETVEKVIQSLVKLYKLKKESFDLDSFYGSDQFLYEIFKPPE